VDTKPPRYAYLPEALKGLGELADNLWWSWHPEARMLFKTLNRQTWKISIHNPVKMLRDLSREICVAASVDPGYLASCEKVLTKFRSETKEDQKCWFSENVSAACPHPIAYFSAEYGLHHSLPFYAGGLGFLAGDFLKECSDLGIPLLAVGFMYPEGYLRQRIREDGWQETMDEILDRDATSISRVLTEKGEQTVIQVPFIEPAIYVAIWKLMIGRVPLYLLDTDIEANDPWNRKIAQHLYIGDLEQRLRQEIVLGIGGSVALGTLGVRHSIVHLNEGHAAFALLERVRERIQSGMSYDEAIEKVRSTSVFTGHTPVAAGHDIFPFDMMEKYFRSYWPALGIDRDRFFQLGTDPKEPSAGFNMTALALRLSSYRNGVSRRHGEVARKMWQSLWPDLSEKEVPIDHVTNGVHVPTWIEPKLHLLFNRYLGPDWLEEHDNPDVWAHIDDIPDHELWQTHYFLKMKLVNTIREFTRRRWVKDQVSTSVVISGGMLLDPSLLTVGFARRFATYKRADLILYDIERLKGLLNDRWRPMQIIFAGKAHPADDAGKRMLQKVFNAARDPSFGGRIAFVEDYGEQLAQYLLHGVDVWLNNPLPPMEACGTSGMKAAMNGVPHLSVMDGWWVEGFNGRNGWAFGSEAGDAIGKRADAEALYQTLERAVIPLYYRIAEDGTPKEWVKLMKESMKSNGARFSARRMVKEYVTRFYVNALKEA
jgi:glycogen phosphorylase